jgi:putative endonuclease
MLVYYECYNEIHEAIRREKIIKKWKRKFKVNAIKKTDPEWKDLYFEII